MKPTPEEFERWRASPMTQWFMASLVNGAGLMRDKWINRSWDGNDADPMFLHACKERAGAYLDVTEMTFETIQSLQAASEAE